MLLSRVHGMLGIMDRCHPFQVDQDYCARTPEHLFNLDLFNLDNHPDLCRATVMSAAYQYT